MAGRTSPAQQLANLQALYHAKPAEQHCHGTAQVVALLMSGQHSRCAARNSPTALSTAAQHSPTHLHRNKGSACHPSALSARSSWPDPARDALRAPWLSAAPRPPLLRAGLSAAPSWRSPDSIRCRLLVRGLMTSSLPSPRWLAAAAAAAAAAARQARARRRRFHSAKPVTARAVPNAAAAEASTGSSQRCDPPLLLLLPPSGIAL